MSMLRKYDNRWEEACQEFLKGCSCASPGEPWHCAECTEAFHNRLVSLKKREAEIEAEDRLRAEQGSFG